MIVNVTESDISQFFNLKIVSTNTSKSLNEDVCLVKQVHICLKFEQVGILDLETLLLLNS